MPRGRWKTNPARRETFVRRALKSTNASFLRIGKRVGWAHYKVHRFNEKNDFRTLEHTMDAARANLRTARANQRQKVNLFTQEKKIRLLEEHAGRIRIVTRQWAWNPLIRKTFASEQALWNAVHAHLFFELDYYSEKKSGEKMASMGTFLANHANFFCMRLIRKERGTKEWPVDSDGNAIEIQTRPHQISRRELNRKKAMIPPTAKKILIKLGISIEAAAINGFEDVREELMRRMEDPAAGLIDAEKKALGQGLAGKKQTEIQIVSLKKNGENRSQQQVHIIQNQAIRKIRNFLRRSPLDG